MARKIGFLVLGVLLMATLERCKTFAGANPSPSCMVIHSIRPAVQHIP